MLQRLVNLLGEYPIGGLSHSLLLLPVLIALYRREHLDAKLVLVAIFFFIHFIEESVSLYYVINGKNTIRLQEGFLFIDVLLLIEVFYFAYKGQPRVQRFSIALAVLVGLLVLIFYRYQAVSFVSQSLYRLLLIFFAIAYFNKILAENRVLRVVHHALFWVSAGFLFYGMGTFMTSLFTDYLLHPTRTSKATFDLFWNMGQVVSIIQCILTAVGFWVSCYDQVNYVHTV